ncbi:MAG: exodeoxyribonuclease VII large subunit [Myxococcaceae bacterium]
MKAKRPSEALEGQGDLFGGSLAAVTPEKHVEVPPKVIANEAPALEPAFAVDEHVTNGARPTSLEKLVDIRPLASAKPLHALPTAIREQSAKAERAVLSVGELTRQIKSTLERNFLRVCVRGEVSGFRGANPRGHLYFSLKDSEATLEVKVWASTAQRLRFKLRDGLSVVVEGSVDLYEPSGRYSLIVQRIEPVGEGALALAFAQLKERLAEEGLIGENRKRALRPLPRVPRRIGVVTSVTGAALRDFLRVVHRRHSRMSVLVCDARVQGEGSASEVVRALKRLARTDVDLIVVTRGGGSVEDLWTFNEEAVARAIHACPVPVVSAIGHEVDFTIADFVADLRAATPSAAAEVIVPVLTELEIQLQTASLRLRKAIERQLLSDRQRLHGSTARLSDPRRILGQKRLHLSEQTDRMLRKVRGGLTQRREALKLWQERLGRQRPEAKLQRRRAELTKLNERLQSAMREAFKRRQAELARVRNGVERVSPRSRVAREQKILASQWARLLTRQRHRVSTARTQFHTLEGRLEAMSPLKVMARGYSVAFRQEDGHVIRRADEVTVGSTLTVRFAGPGCDSLEACDSLDATVRAIHPAKPH